MAYANLGNAQGDFSKAIEYHAQHLAIAKEVGDRAGRAGRTRTSGARISRRGTSAMPSSTTRSAWRLQRRWATGRGRAGRTRTSATHIGRRMTSARPSSTTRSAWRLQRRWATGRGRARRTGTSATRISRRVTSARPSSTTRTHHLTIAKEVGDRAGEGAAYRNLGTCHMHLNEYVKAVAYFEAQYALAISLKLAHVQSDVALNMGLALTLHVRAARQGPATGVDQAPGPHSHSSASACLDDRRALGWNAPRAP
jgi:hypothetical protein